MLEYCFLCLICGTLLQCGISLVCYTYTFLSCVECEPHFPRRFLCPTAFTRSNGWDHWQRWQWCVSLHLSWRNGVCCEGDWPASGRARDMVFCEPSQRDWNVCCHWGRLGPCLPWSKTLLPDDAEDHGWVKGVPSWLISKLSSYNFCLICRYSTEWRLLLFYSHIRVQLANLSSKCFGLLQVNVATMGKIMSA